MGESVNRGGDGIAVVSVHEGVAAGALVDGGGEERADDGGGSINLCSLV